jgi:hypothetical protein
LDSTISLGRKDILLNPIPGVTGIAALAMLLVQLTDLFAGVGAAPE